MDCLLRPPVPTSRLFAFEWSESIAKDDQPEAKDVRALLRAALLTVSRRRVRHCA